MNNSYGGETWVPGAAAALPGKSPIVGSATESASAGQTLSSIRNDVNAYVDLTYAAATTFRDLTASSVEQLTTKIIHRMLPGGKSLSKDLKAAMKAFKTHADTVEAVHDAAREVIEAVEQELSVIRNASRALHDAANSLRVSSGVVPRSWDELPNLTPPAPVGETMFIEKFSAPSMNFYAQDQWQSSARRWHNAQDRIQSRIFQWIDLIVKRQESERALEAVLQQTELGALIILQGRPVSRKAITTALTGEPVHPRRISGTELQKLLEGVLTPEEVAKLWVEQGFNDLTKAEIEAWPIATLFGLASLAGVPAKFQDWASREALAYAVKNSEEAHRLMGFAGAMSLGEFTQQVKSLKTDLRNAEDKAVNLEPKPQIQLIGFGNHDDALTGGLVLGDIDSATHVGVNVSGMDSSLNDFSNNFKGSINLFNSAQDKNELEAGYAVVHWIGYRPPKKPLADWGVLSMDRAEAGAIPLSNLIDGIYESREATSNTTFKSFMVLGHSYGSTTAIEALKLTDHKIDNLITYGSAGMKESTTADQLNVHNIHVTHALGDQLAILGIVASGRDAPQSMTDINWFSSGGYLNNDRVTMHSMYSDEGDGSLLNRTKTGYLSEGTPSVKYMGKVLASDSK